MCIFFPLAELMYIIDLLFFKSAWRDMDQVCQCQRTASVTTNNPTHSFVLTYIDFLLEINLSRECADELFSCND